MNDEQLKSRDMFLTALSEAGWSGSNTNRNFDAGLWTSPEASMTFSNAQVSLQFDLALEDPRAILYINSTQGKQLGLVFKCNDRLKPLLDTVVGMQATISPGNIKEKSEQLLAACPNMFKISGSGNKMIPVKPQRSG